MLQVAPENNGYNDFSNFKLPRELRFQVVDATVVVVALHYGIEITLRPCFRPLRRGNNPAS